MLDYKNLNKSKIAKFRLKILYIESGGEIPSDAVFSWTSEKSPPECPAFSAFSRLKGSETFVYLFCNSEDDRFPSIIGSSFKGICFLRSFAVLIGGGSETGSSWCNNYQIKIRLSREPHTKICVKRPLNSPIFVLIFRFFNSSIHSGCPLETNLTFFPYFNGVVWGTAVIYLNCLVLYFFEIFFGNYCSNWLHNQLTLIRFK